MTGLVWATAAAASSDPAPLGRGVAALKAGDARAARVELLNAIQADPNAGLPHALQARAYLMLGDGVAAQAALDRAHAGGIAAERIAHLNAHAALLRGEADRALTLAASAKVADRFAPYAARIRAKARTAKGELEAASAEYDAALALTPRSAPLWADIGRFRLGSADLAGALDAAQTALAIDPRNVDALVLSGELIRTRYGLLAALPWFERALDVDPGHVPALLEQAATLGEAGRYREMLAATRLTLSLSPGNGRAYYLQAVMAARAGKAELARALLQRAGRSLEEPAGLMLAAALDLQAGANESAVIRLRRLTALQPQNFRVLELYGLALLRTGDADGAAEALTPLATRADADGYGLLLAARSLEAGGRLGDGAALFDRANGESRGDPAPFESAVLEGDGSNAEVAVPMIRALARAGRAEAALAAARGLQRDNPGVPAAYALVGDAFALQGRHADAADAYRVAANYSFSGPNALRLIDALGRTGRNAEALRSLDLYLAQNPRSVDAMQLAAGTLASAGRWDRARAMLEALRARTGNRDAMLLANLAWANLNLGDRERALAYARAAYALAPANAGVASAYGWMQVRAGGDRIAGMALLAQAVATAPGDAALRQRLADARRGGARL